MYTLLERGEGWKGRGKRGRLLRELDWEEMSEGKNRVSCAPPHPQFGINAGKVNYLSFFLAASQTRRYC